MNPITQYVLKPIGKVLMPLVIGSQVLGAGIAYAGDNKGFLETLRSEYKPIGEMTVKPKESFSSIVKGMGIPIAPEDLAKIHGIKPEELRVGQKIDIYSPNDVEAMAKAIDAYNASNQIKENCKEGGLEKTIVPGAAQRNAAIKHFNEKMGEGLPGSKYSTKDSTIAQVKAQADAGKQLDAKMAEVTAMVDLNAQAEASHKGYVFPGTKMPSPKEIREEIRGSKPITINAAENAAISQAIREQHPQAGEYAPERGMWGEDNATAVVQAKGLAAKGQGLEARTGNWGPGYAIQRSTLFGYDLGQVSPRVSSFIDGERFTLEEKLGANFVNLPQLMETHNFYMLGGGDGYGLFIEPKNDRIDVLVASEARQLTSRQSIQNAIIQVMRDNNMTYAGSYVAGVKRGSSLDDRIDNIGFAIGPVDVDSGRSRTDVVEEGQQENLTMRFKEDKEKVNGGDGAGGSGGSSGSSGSGGPGGNSGGGGGVSHLQLPHQQQRLAAKALNWRNV